MIGASRDKSASEKQVKFIVLMGAMAEEDAKKLSRYDAHVLITAEMPKFHARKLVEWGFKRQWEVNRMLPDQLRTLFRHFSKVRRNRQINEILDTYSIGEKVWHKNRKEVCAVVVIRYMESYTEYCNNFSVEFADGKRQAISRHAIKKLKSTGQ